MRGNILLCGVVVAISAVLILGLTRANHRYAVEAYEDKMRIFVNHCMEAGNPHDRCALIYGMGGK